MSRATIQSLADDIAHSHKLLVGMPKPLDLDCDLGNGDYCVGPDLGCLHCREDAGTRYSSQGYDTPVLICNECLEVVLWL